MIKSAEINGKKVYAFNSFDEVTDFIEKKKTILIALNAEKALVVDNQLTDLINSNVGYPDGVGIVLALRSKGIKSVRVPGADLWIEITRKFHAHKSFYLVGGSTEVIELTIKKLHDQFSGIRILNFRDGYLKTGELEQLKKDICERKPDIVYVAMGSPKQEFIMEELSKIHPALYMGLGGSFDVYTEKKRRAPKVFMKLGLEWFYRLLREPTRIKRQLVYFKFLMLLIFRKL